MVNKNGGHRHQCNRCRLDGQQLAHFLNRSRDHVNQDRDDNALRELVYHRVVSPTPPRRKRNAQDHVGEEQEKYLEFEGEPLAAAGGNQENHREQGNSA
jgi:hypothetical protein